MPGNKKAFPLRLDPDIYRAIERWADDEFRSVNAHIEYLLREALRKAGRLPAKGMEAPDPDPGAEGQPGGQESG